MFFQESYTIEESLRKIQQEFFRDIDIQLGLLQLRLRESNNSPEIVNDNVEQALHRFTSEFQSLKRLFEWILVPAVTKCLSDDQCVRPFDGFTVLRASHEKQRLAMDALRSDCDLFVLQESWTEEKKGHCLTSYRLYNAYLSYLNFAESTLIPLLKKLHQNAIQSMQHVDTNEKS